MEGFFETGIGNSSSSSIWISKSGTQ